MLKKRNTDKTQSTVTLIFLLCTIVSFGWTVRSANALEIGGVDLGDLTDYLVFVADGSNGAGWQGASKGFVGDVAVDGIDANENTSGTVPYAGTIYTNDTTLGAWQDIVDNNAGQASASTGNTALITDLENTLNAAFLTINGLAATSTTTGPADPVGSGGLNGLNTENGVAETFVIDITGGFSISSFVEITGDPGDVFIFRWDSDANLSNGYNGQVKFSNGGGFIPLGGLSPSNFIHVAGDINASGGGNAPADSYPFYPVGPYLGNGFETLVTGGSDFDQGGFFTGYWLTTGQPANAPDASHSVPYGKTSDLSNGIIVGGWYTISDQFKSTSGSSGVYVGPLDHGDLPETKYLTTRQTTGDSGPAHVITDDLYMGTNFTTDIDAEGDGQPNATATGDQNVNKSDETAVTFPTFTIGQPANLTVSVTNNTGGDATLYGFIDWNGDGDFDDTGESVSTTVADGTAGNVMLTFNVPPGATTGADLGARFRLSTATGLSATDPLGNNGPVPAPDGEVEDYLIQAVVPVTLSYFSSTRTHSYIEVDWSTSSELFNVGFQLWGLDGADSKWEKLHGWLIRSGSGNAVEPQSYSKKVNIPRSINELVALGISSVDSDGSEHYYGPFDVGRSYGNLNTLKPIAWNHIRKQVDAEMVSRGYIKDRINGYRKISTSESISTSQSVIEIGIREKGVYRITANDLLDAGMDWRDVSKRNIALIDHTGKAVVRYVSASGTGTGLDKSLGAAGEIYFYAAGVDEKDGLYTETSVYRLLEDRYRALEGQYQGKQGIKSGFSGYYVETSRVENDSHYVLNTTADDPWVDAVVLSYPNRHRSYSTWIPVEADTLWSVPSVMTLELAPSSRLSAVDVNDDGKQDPEHVIEGIVLSPKGTKGVLSLGKMQAVGRGKWRVDFEIPGDTPLSIIDGNALIGGHFSAGPGYAFSEVHVDSASISYARPTVAKAGDDYLMFTGQNTGESGYDVTIPDKGWPVAFAFNEQGAIVRLALESQSRVTASDGTRLRQVKLAALNGAGQLTSPVQYWVSGKRGFKQVESLSTRSIALKSTLLVQAAGSNYLMIAHPVFIGSTLDYYADFKRGQGYSVSVIDYLEIVDAFGGGQSGPHGLTNYLAMVEKQDDLDHVLIVGGSSYDHTGKLDSGAMTFVPGHYGQSNYSNFTVSDVPYISGANNDLFASIGRWPVRIASDLKTIVDKSIAWENSDHRNGTALLIAEHTLAGENIDFASAVDTLVPLMPSSWVTKKVYVDQVAAANNLSLPGDLPQALSLAKTAIIGELNKTPSVVLYNGHGTTSQLSNRGLFKSGDVASITAEGAEIWLTMSCYVTFYESTHVNTLAHQLMFNGNAVNISGAMLLSNHSTNLAAGQAILDSTLNKGRRIGEAVNAHKMSQGSQSLNINWALLGDPTSRF